MRSAIILLLSTSCFAQTLINRNAPPGVPGTCAGMVAGVDYITGGDLNGFKPLAASSFLYRDVSGDAPDPKSLAYKQNLASDKSTDNFRLRAGYPYYGGSVEGMPAHVVDGPAQPRITVDTIEGAFDSDPGPFPVPPMPMVQFKTAPPDAMRPLKGKPYFMWPVTGSDDHVIVIDRAECVLTEFWQFRYDPVTGKARAATAAVYDLLAGDTQRPNMLSSGSVGGVPLWPMFVKPENLRATNPVPIDHALIATAFVYPNGNFWSKHSFVWPAQHHQYGGGLNGNYYDVKDFPIGARIRWNPNVPTTYLSPQSVSIVNALKKYGAIISDGGNMFDLYASASRNWNNGVTPGGDVGSLWMGGSAYSNGTRFSESNYEVVTGQDKTTYCDQMYATKTAQGGCVKVTGSGATVPPWTDPVPTINAFNASQTTVSAGTPVTLTWNLGGMKTRLKFITPDVGYTTKDSVVVNPTKTTTYTLMVQSSGGRATRTITIIVY